MSFKMRFFKCGIKRMICSTSFTLSLFKVCLFFSKIWGIVGFFLFFPSCNFYPRYQRPCMEMPEHWRIATDETESILNARWWEQFQDLVLNELIEEALQSNYDLRTSTARIAQFQAQLGIVNAQLDPCRPA